MNKSSKLSAKFYKIVQNDVPYANSVVNTINENLNEEVSSLFANLHFKCPTKLYNVCLIYFQITWIIAEIGASFVLVQFFFYN